jgi:hypothetical protein
MITMVSTTIQIDSLTRKKLACLKTTPRETYDEVLNRLMALVPLGDDEGPYTDAFRMGLLVAKCDIKAGLLVDNSEVKRRLGLK